MQVPGSTLISMKILSLLLALLLLFCPAAPDDAYFGKLRTCSCHPNWFKPHPLHSDKACHHHRQRRTRAPDSIVVLSSTFSGPLEANLPCHDCYGNKNKPAQSSGIHKRGLKEKERHIYKWSMEQKFSFVDLPKI
ncbi:uncharacterized protein LOC133382828 isoform X5 [Rhineura floridana]|uniref:uncharacterized protein LOC133382828 isoform X5 n=1 Tax=Rhineura floridana TaxID=261503 RepID=UPI002AC80C03|nr:uncharacterized protein LOC133382828 isoform X5 [Rhineura floridana]